MNKPGCAYGVGIILGSFSGAIAVLRDFEWWFPGIIFIMGLILLVVSLNQGDALVSGEEQ